MMKILINGEVYETKARKLSDLISEKKPTPPFAVAVNLRFIARVHYYDTEIFENDEVEIVAPMVGG